MKTQIFPDFRKVPHRERFAIRKLAVLRVKRGTPIEFVARLFHVGVRTLKVWLARYALGGFSALHYRSKRGRPLKLTEDQMQWVLETVRDKTPLQQKFTFAYWTLKRVQYLIYWRFDVTLCLSTVRNVLRRVGLTPQRPKCRAYQQDSEVVQQWKENEFLEIKKKVNQEKGILVFADEAGMRSDYHTGTTWAPKNQTPIVKFTGARFRLNMLSAVSSDGQIFFMVHEGTATSATFCEFLQQILDAVKEETIHVVVDRHTIHTAAAVNAFLQSEGDRIQLHLLPAYSPELNPDELVWSVVKRKVGQQLIQTKEELKTQLTAALQELKDCPDKVKGLFKEPDCQYILA